MCKLKFVAMPERRIAQISICVFSLHNQYAWLQPPLFHLWMFDILNENVLRRILQSEKGRVKYENYTQLYERINGSK